MRLNFFYSLALTFIYTSVSDNQEESYGSRVNTNTKAWEYNGKIIMAWPDAIYRNSTEGKKKHKERSLGTQHQWFSLLRLEKENTVSQDQHAQLWPCANYSASPPTTFNGHRRMFMLLLLPTEKPTSAPEFLWMALSEIFIPRREISFLPYILYRIND